MNLLSIFVTGLLAGGLSCASVQAGLLAAAVARNRAQSTERKLTCDTVPLPSTPVVSRSRIGADVVPVTGFLAGKLISHTAVGAALGAAGGQLPLGPPARGSIQLAAGLYMLLFAVEQIFDIRALLPRPPSSWARVVRRSGRLGPTIGPAAFGAATVLVPCGVTLSVAFLALASGSFTSGAAVMGAFVLGTAPLFAAIGVAARRAGRSNRARWRWVTGAAITASAMVSINAGLVVLDSPYAPQRAWQALARDAEEDVSTIDGTADGVQRATIRVTGDGYEPDHLRLRSGVPTTITFEATGFG